MLRNLLLTTLVAASSLSLAAPQSFSSRITNVRAGVVVLEADSGGGLPARTTAPFAWLNLDRATGVKPAGWSIDNPYSPGAVSTQTAIRWSALIPSLGGAPVPVVSDRIARTEAAYWEVFLTGITDTQLSNYDVLLVAPSVNVQLNTVEREKLRKFVDQGGVLWVDYGAAQNPADLINNMPIAVRLQSVPGNLSQQADFRQSLLSSPFGLTASDMGLLNVPYGNPWLMGEVRPADLTLPNLFLGLSGESYNRLQSVAKVGNTFDSVSIGRIGDGFVVFTARGIAHKLNETTVRNATTGRYVVSPNQGYRAGDTLASTRGTAAARFAINVISLSSSFRQQNGGSRRQGSIATSVVAPPSLRFSTTAGAGSPNPAANTQPIIYKNILVVNGSDNRLRAYDTDPSRDIDGDGNPDDGAPDFNLGSPYDLIWTSRPLSSPSSSPTATTIENPSIVLRSKDQVLVTELNGSVSSFPLLPINPATGYLRQDASVTNLAHDFQVGTPNGTNVNVGGVVNSPTVHEGQVFVADNATNGGQTRGRVWMFDLATGTRIASTTNFALGGTGSRVTMPQVSFSPTVGYVPIQDNSGGFDRLLYYPTLPTGTNVNSAAGIASIWIGARGEKPSDVTVDSGSNRLLVSTRASSQGGLPVFTPGVGSAYRSLAPRITVIDQAGNPWTQAQMAAFFTDSAPMNMDAGVVGFQLRTGVTWPNDDGSTANDVDIRIDYTVDWGAGNVEELTGAFRGNINLPDNGNNRRIIGSIAMGPTGTLFFNSTGSIAGDGGAFYGIREEGRGIFKCLIRYEVFDQHRIAMNDGTSINYEPTIIDVDNVNDYVPSANANDSRLRGFLLRGSPVIRNGQVFVAAQASKFVTIPGFGRVPAPVAVLMAFNADPGLPEIPVGRFPAGSALVQPDLGRSSAASSGGIKQPDQFSILNTNYDYDETRGVVRISSLMGNDRGVIQNSLSLSQPVIVRRSDGTDRLVEPNNVGGRWSPLNWYTTVNGTTLENTPNVLLLAGSTIYMVGESVVPGILSGEGTLSNTGVIVAYDSEVPSNDPDLRNPTVRPWQKQVVQDLAPGVANFTGNRHVRWPLLSGLTGFSDYIVRLNQTRLRNSTTGLGIIGGDETIVAWGSAGSYAFGDSNIIVCDQNRVGLFDPSGDAILSLDAILAPGKANDAGAARPTALARPTRAYSLGTGEFLLVDSGANSVGRVDSAGVARRLISEFIIDPQNVPDGYQANETLKLSGPRDAVTWTEVAVLGSNPVFTNQQPVEYWVHTLIADGGNNRLVQLVDRYGYDVASSRVLEPITVANVPQLGVLRWHSPASISGREFSYNSLSRVFVPGTVSTPARYVYVAGIGNTLPTNTGVGLDTSGAGDPLPSGGGNGGVVILDPANPRYVQVINQLAVPDWSGTPVWFDAANGTGQFISAASLGDPRLINRRLGATRLMSNVTSVTARVVQVAGNPVVMVMVSDANGVFEFPLPSGTSTVGGVTWMMPTDVYRGIRPIFARNVASTEDKNPENFRPMYAKRMSNGEVLIVNGYFGRRRNGNNFYGEVVQINPTFYDLAAENLGFRISSISYELGPIQGTRGLVQPIFADRR